MFDFDHNGVMDPGEEYLAFRIWEEMCLEDGEEEQDARDDEEDEEPVRRKGIRIEHPHVIDDTDYECSVCGHRFGGAAGSCPSCGTVFGGEKTDYEEFDFEEDELEAWDEEDGW